MDSKQKFSGDDVPLLSTPFEYRRVDGKLLYLTITKPDIAYTVQTLSQYMSKPNENHLQAVHRLLRYLKSTIGQGLFYSSNNNLKLHSD